MSLDWHRSEQSDYCEIDSASDGSAHWMLVRSPRGSTRTHADICVWVDMRFGFAPTESAPEIAEALRVEVTQEVAALVERLRLRHGLRTRADLSAARQAALAGEGA